MRVLMIAPQPFLEPRGTPISVYQRLSGLAALGHRVDLLTYHLGEDVQIPNVTIHRIPNVPCIQRVRVGPSWQKLVLDILLICVAVKLLVSNRYDVIHTHEEAAFFALFLAGLFGTQHIYDMHSSLPQQLINFNFATYRPIIKLFEVLERWTLRTCDAVITIGSDLEEYARAINPAGNHITIENLPIQLNGLAAYASQPNGLRMQLGLQNKLPIVYTGTFEPYQGVDLLIESARILRDSHTDVSFVLVGGQPHQIAHWQNVVRQYELEDRVLFVGAVPVDEVQSYLDIAEILVSPRIEGLSVPLKVYTYLHSGKPIVATNVAAHTLVLNEDTAVLAEPTGQAFAGALGRVIQDANLRGRLGLQAKRLAEEKYGIPTYLMKLDQIYQKIHPHADTVAQSTHLVDHLNKHSLEN